MYYWFEISSNYTLLGSGKTKNDFNNFAVHHKGSLNLQLFINLYYQYTQFN